MDDSTNERTYKRRVRPQSLAKICLKCIKKQPEALKNKIFHHPLNNKILRYLFKTRACVTLEDIKGILFCIDKINFTETVFDAQEVLEELSKRTPYLKKLHLGGTPYDEDDLNRLVITVEKFQTNELQASVAANKEGSKVIEKFNKKLTTLTLDYGPIEGDFMHKLQFYCPNLVKIALAHPSITGKALKPLLDMPALASFKAFSCTLDDAFVTELTRTKPHLKELLISWNECPLHVSSFIGFKELTSLGLSYTPLVYDLDLAEILQNNRNLKHLLLTKCSVSEFTCKAMSDLVKLQGLIMPETALLSEYFIHLAKCTSLTKLDISDVTLINDDMCHFIPSLPRLKVLEIDSIAFFENDKDCRIAPSLKKIITRPACKFDLPSVMRKCPKLELIIVEEL